MPNEKIAATVTNNGEKEIIINELRVLWGAAGSAPEAPEGWVNAGYSQIAITHQKVPDEAETTYTIELDEYGLDRLIKVLKRVRRQTTRSSRIRLSEFK